MPSSDAFSNSRLLLCEGTEDVSFLRALVSARGIGPFDIRPVIDLAGAGGKDNFGRALTNAVPMTGFRGIDHIGIIADADDHYRNSFNEICEQIRDSNTRPAVSGRFGIPTDPYVYANGYPRIIIILLPGRNKRGCLESLLWNAIESNVKYGGIIQCVNDACRCGHAANWPKSKFDKARIHIALALRHRPNPAVGLGRLWTQYPDAIPIDDPVFEDLAVVIGSIGQ